MDEIQINSILKRAKSLIEIVEKPLARKVLEIDITANSARNLDLLARVIRSLEQYVNKEQTLIYVGFVGHYSSGKSSTINNLLCVKNSIHERQTGLNPTDKAITLITSIHNSNALILMNREGGAVPVRTSFIDNELLKTLVIADTPGSGDPQVVNEMIQDFLPICDYILYFISAANPVDQADLPLLKQKTQKLPFIPVLFVITRTDEFRIDKGFPLSEENIDTTKKDSFIGQLLSRIKEIVKTDDLKLEDFVFVDNEFNYRINTIKTTLIEWSSNLDKEQLIKIHGYKVEYYRSNLDAIYSYFIGAIEEKIKKSKEFLKTANENILRFDKSIELNNEKLKLLWAKSETALKQSLLDDNKVISEISQITVPINLAYDRDLNLERKVINQNIESQANGYLGKIVLDINNHFKQRLRELKHNMLSNINSENILLENISHLFPGRLDFDTSYNKLEIDFSKLNEYSRMFSNRVGIILNDVKNSLRSKVQQFRTLIAREAIIKTLTQLYGSGRSTISDNFDQYFERIQMYRSTVLTRNTLETIEKLRIGTQLDELDDEFSEEFISEMKNRATEEIYFPSEQEINSYHHHIEKSHALLLEIRSEIDKIEVRKEIEYLTFARETIDISTFVNGLIQQGEETVNLLYQDKLIEVLDKHSDNYQNYLNSIVLIRKRRRKNIAKWTALIGLTFIIIYLGLRHLNVISPSTISSDVFIGLLTTGLGNIIGLVIGMFKNDVKKITLVNRNQFLENAKSDLLQLFGENFWDEVSRKVVEERTNVSSPFIKSMFEQRMNPVLKATLEKDQTLLDSLNAINKKINGVISSHKIRFEQLYNKFHSIFTESDKNVEKISVITKHIKEVAIKPSFDLLKETTENLENVKAQIQNI